VQCVTKVGESCHPKGWPLSLSITSLPPPATEGKQVQDAEKTPQAPLAEQVRDLKMKHLATLSAQAKDSEWEQLFIELAVEFPSFLPLKAAKLHHVDKKGNRAGHLPSVVQAADDVIASIDKTTLAAHFGLKLVDGDKTMEVARKKFSKEKAIFVDALARKARAEADLEVASVLPISPATNLAWPAAKSKDEAQAAKEVSGFGATVRLLQQWEDIEDPAKADVYARVHTAWLAKQGKLGALLKYLKQAVPETKDEDLEKQLYELRAAVQEALGWLHISQYECVWAAINRPKDFALF